MVEYAQSFVRNDTCEDDYQKYFTCRAEFIEWTDNPDAWAGAWAGEYVLAIVYDHSMTKIKSIKETLASDESYAKYSIYNVPYSFRKLIPDTCHVGDDICSRGAITHQEYQSLWSDMGELDREIWTKSQNACFESLQKETNSYPTIEQPVKIHLTGTDDFSYSLCVATRKEAFEIVEGLKNCPTWSLLKDYGFIFTN